MKRYGILLIGSLTLAGCGDDDANGFDAGPRGDSGVLADAGGRDSGSDASPPPDASGDGGVTDCVLDRLLVATSDFVTGGLGTVDVASGAVSLLGGDAGDQDLVPAVAGCTPVVLERGTGTLLVQSADDPLVTERSIDLNPAGGLGPYAANPQTIAAVPDGRAYVLLQATAAIAVVDLRAGEVTSTIDLTSLAKAADADGNPDPLDLLVVDDRAYVALGHYWFDSSFAIQFEGSELAVVDTTTDALVDVDTTAPGLQAIALEGENPWRGMHHDAAVDQLWVGCAGDAFDPTDGRIEVVDLATSTTAGTVVTESELGGELGGFAVVAPTRLVVLAGDTFAGAAVVAFDPTIDFPTAPEELATEIHGLRLVDDTLWVWSRAGADLGLRALDPDDGADVTPGGSTLGLGPLPVSGVAPSP
jgi:hypothetical protein